MSDIFGKINKERPVEINIYADEIQSKICPYTNEKWIYIGIIVEKLLDPILEDIKQERYCHNLDPLSPYYSQNNRIVHWSEINDADTKNICKRWFMYILNIDKSGNKFYSYILGINDSKLNKNEFDRKGQFNSKYNRFFRSAVLYGIKTFFPNKKVIVQKIYHEEGPQQHDKYFPWHCIYKISQKEDFISFKEKNIEFLPKDHKKDERSNIIQLCDAFMGACTSIIHGIRKSRTSMYREELIDIIFPLVKRMIEKPYNKNSRYKYYNRIIMRFFPRENTNTDDIKRMQNQFYIFRRLYCEEKMSEQLLLF